MVKFPSPRLSVPLVLALTPLACLSADNKPELAIPRVAKSSGPYCGINCVYAASQYYQRHASYSTLVDPRFVGSYQGSSPLELLAATESLGLAATPKSGMTIDDLRSLNYPSILLLSRHRDSAAFNHWVLVVQCNRDGIQVMESPDNIEFMKYSQLLAQWDGLGLVIYPDAATKTAADSYHTAWRSAVATFTALACVSLFAARMWLPAALRVPDFRPRTAILTCCGILATGIAMALLWHSLAPTGFFRNADAIAIVKWGVFSRQLPHIGFQELDELIEKKHAIVIDARYEENYVLGHIPSAISVPVHISPTALQEFAKKVPKDKQVVVYCQSDGCPYDEQIGAQLHMAGINNVTLFQGGWKEWKQSTLHRKSSNPSGSEEVRQ
ncbi:MAG: rhodanese-like domain-containing protein [Pirellulaceae bacterium]